MEKIKVLIVADTMNMGGLENQLVHLLRNADQDLFQLDYVCRNPEAYYRGEIENLGGRFYSIPKMNWLWPFPYCRALRRLMINGKYDVVHSNELFHSGIVLKIAKSAGVQGRIAHSHSFSDGDGIKSKRSAVRSFYNRVMRRWILKYSNIQIACAFPAGEFLFGEEGVKRDSFRLVYNSIDTKKYLDRYDRKETGEFCGDGWINVLHVGRVYPVKRQMLDVEIAKQFKEEGKKIRILCAGTAADEEYLEQIKKSVKESELHEYIYMLGGRDDVDVLYRKASVAILPSVYEGMPLAMIEAQASGLPCVAADTFSREVDFELGMVQWLPASATAKEWAKAIENAVCRRRLEYEKVEKAIKEKKFDAGEFAKTIFGIYKESLRDR